jgi:hypothetical protein
MKLIYQSFYKIHGMYVIPWAGNLMEETPHVQWDLLYSNGLLFVFVFLTIWYQPSENQYHLYICK